MADGVEQIAAQVDPVGQIIEGYVRPNGLRIQKVRVPIGVVLFFYESRPNVTSDAAALCLKSGNAIILRGGKEALHSNRAIAQIIADAPDDSRRSIPAAVQLVESTDRALVPHLLKLDKYIDLVIPRGGESLIRAVVKDSTIPVLKHFTGNCHIYIDAATDGMEQQVREVCVNAKTSYPGGAVCNAVENICCSTRTPPRGCWPRSATTWPPRAWRSAATSAPAPSTRRPSRATEADWRHRIPELRRRREGGRFAGRGGRPTSTSTASHHTDAILTERRPSRRSTFVSGVDSASVMVNASTRFADGGEYGLGAEIGISTDKLHARGPMGASDLTTYKWVVTGEGHVR